MTTWLRRRETVNIADYRLTWESNDTPGSGWSFPCDEHGNPTEMNPAMFANYLECLAGSNDTRPTGVQKYLRTFVEPGAIECDHCRREVVLADYDTNECECGALYNVWGQRLAPRSEWEESCCSDDDDF